jgi:hypothetical protein
MAPDLPAALWPVFLRLALEDAAPSTLTPEAFHRVLTCATEEGLLPLLYDDAAVPETVREATMKAPAIRSLHLRRLGLHLQAARTLVETLGPDGCLFIKGFDYRFRLYARPELRPSADLDVFIPLERVDDAIARLTSAGGRLAFSKGTALWGRDYYEVGLDIGEVRIEIHRTIGQRLRTSVDYESVWAQREPFRAGDFETRRLAPLHAMGVHVLNLAKDELSSPLIRFVDFFLMLRLWPDLVPALPELARAWRIERALYGSLRLVTALFREVETEAITQAMEGVLSPGARRFLDASVIPNRLKTLSGHRDGRVLQLWRKWWLTDGVARRAVFLGTWFGRSLLDSRPGGSRR